MIWRRLKKSTPEQEREFTTGMQEVKPTFKEKLVMVLTAYVTILLPSVLVLIVLVLLCMWFFGLL